MKKETNSKVTTTVYQEITDDDLRRVSPSQVLGMVTVVYPNPEDPSEDITSDFEICDGFAFSIAEVDGQKREVYATFPMVKFVNTMAKNMKTKVLNALGITPERDLTPVELFQVYGEINFVDNLKQSIKVTNG